MARSSTGGKEGALGTCYLFLGPETGEKEDAVGEIRERLGGAGSFEETSFYAGEIPVSRICSILLNGSLFADSRLFLIKNAELVTKKDETALLASYIASPEPSTTLILISGETGISKVIEEKIDRKNRRVFWELFENRKTEWVESFFRRGGCRIDAGGVEAILELVENNTEALRRECSKLMLFLGKERTINGADVEKWLSHTREESAFTLFSRIAAGDLSKGIESLHALLAARETPQAILAGLAWCFRRLRDYLALSAAGETDMRKIGLTNPKARSDYTLAAGRYDTDAAEDCLSLTAEYDVLVRSSGAGLEQILMDLYLCKIHGRASGA
ncbi:MAG: DNA polymerase III subunit delta [Treponema sp.]|jgi:DNA polymerase-3 subunit delta|nr:DNA polymerase III subunit delta [Treponema sp.]